VNIQVKLAIIAIIIVIPLSSIAVYGTNTNQQFTINDDSKLQVISSFNPLHEFSQIVGQEKVDTILLVPVGVEPHDWEPTIKDVQQMHKSDLIIINGIGFENWVDNLIENNYLGIIVDTSNGITINQSKEQHDEEQHDEEQHDEEQHDEEQHDEEQHDEEQHDEHKHLAGDPHIWLNPVYAKTQVQNIANAFANSDLKNSKFYHTNAEEYNKKLDLLDMKIRNELSNCNSDFIVFHNAFSYFADEYGLNQYTIMPTNNSHGEVTAKTLEKIILTAKKLNIKVIFSEEDISSKSSEIIANELGGNVLILSTLEITSDGTYISKMTENLENLKVALCQ
jgi:zinc transport system substrate-binding protein